MGESSVDRTIDRWSFVGILVGCVAYGLHIVFAIACVRAIRRSTAFTDYPRRAHIAIAYVVVLFTIATLNIGVKTAEWVDLFVDQRLLPSGPALTGTTYHGWTNTVSNICNILSLGWLSDLVLIWRAWMLWNKSIRWILLPFTLIYLALVALSIVDIYGNGWAHKQTFPTLSVSLAYNWMWLGANIILTALVVVRLLWMSHRAKRFASSTHSKQYISIAAMVVESGFPLTMVEAIYCAVGTKNPVALTAVYPLLMQVVAISPELIIWRVAKSRSYHEDDISLDRVTVPVPLKNLRGKPRHGTSKMSSLVFKNPTRTDQGSDTGLEVTSSAVVVSDVQGRAAERGLRRTNSGAVPVVLDLDRAHDAHSQGGHLGRSDSSENVGRMV